MNASGSDIRTTIRILIYDSVTEDCHDNVAWRCRVGLSTLSCITGGSGVLKWRPRRRASLRINFPADLILLRGDIHVGSRRIAESPHRLSSFRRSECLSTHGSPSVGVVERNALIRLFTTRRVRKCPRSR
jgi:hypothetical protein